MPAPLIALGASLLPNVVGLFTGGGQKRQAREAARQAEAGFNTALGFANQGLAKAKNFESLARQNYNGRMAGSGVVEAGIYGNQANTLAALGRNSTSAAQQLALAGAVQGNTNDAFQNLGLMEAQDKARRFGELSYANQGVQAQQNNLGNLYLNRSNQLQGNASQLGQAGQINQFQALQGMANVGIAAGMGQFGNLFGGGNQSGVTQPALSAGAIQPTQFNPWSGMSAPRLPMDLTLPGLISKR